MSQKSPADHHQPYDLAAAVEIVVPLDRGDRAALDGLTPAELEAVRAAGVAAAVEVAAGLRAVS